MRHRLAAAASTSLIALAIFSGPASADEPIIGNIVVMAQSVDPGGSFPVTGYGMDPGLEISFVVTQGSTSAPAGSAIAAADGTFTATLAVPAAFTSGYAELVGMGKDGGRWVASVLVGPEPSPPSQEVVVPLQTRVPALVVLVVGLVIFVIAGLRYVLGQRRRSKSPG